MCRRRKQWKQWLLFPSACCASVHVKNLPCSLVLTTVCWQGRIWLGLPQHLFNLQLNVTVTNSAFLQLLSWLLHISHSTPPPKKRVNLQLSFCLVLTSSSLVSHSSNGKQSPNKHGQNRVRKEKYLLFEKVSFVFLLTHKHFVFTIMGISAVLYWHANGSFIGVLYIYIGLFMWMHACFSTHTLPQPCKKLASRVV